MSKHHQVYSAQSSDPINIQQNNVVVVPDIAMTAASTKELILSGIVYNQNLVGINGISVVLYSATGVPFAQATTETVNKKEGCFSITFEGDMNTSYTLIASGMNYNTSYQEIIFNGKKENVNFYLTANVNTKIIYGVVTDLNGKGLKGAIVRISDATSDIVTVLTMSDGSYVAYDEFTVGTNYTVNVSLLGYISGNMTAVIVDNTNSAFAPIKLTQSDGNVTSVVGTIVNAKSSVPIQNAMVGLYQMTVSSFKLIATTYTDVYGYYAFTNVPMGSNYIVKATKIE
ncbi:hypothetical protein lbkm_0167 [Lachnospiraceae bacterium KM106-2]|nr:hypothetical protein lbkm_0167 [Lachnospiraceae bacterium KM106-2]